MSNTSIRAYLLLLLAFSAGLFGQCTLSNASVYTGPSGGFWDNISNWTPAGFPDNPTTNVCISANNTVVIMEGFPRSVANLQFGINDALYVPSFGKLTVAGNSINLGGASEIVLGSPGLPGPASLVLNAGATVLSGGTLRLINNSVVTAATATNLVNQNNIITGDGNLGNGTNLQVTNGAFGVIQAGSSGLVINGTGAFTNYGTLESFNSSTLFVSSPLDPLTFSSGTLHTGRYDMSPGFIYMYGLGTGANSGLVNNEADIALLGPNATTGLLNGGFYNALTPLVNNSGSLTIDGGYQFTTAGTFNDSGTLGVSINSRGGSLAVSGDLNNSGLGAAISVGSSGNVTVAGNLNNGGVISVYSGGNLGVTGSYSGAGALIGGSLSASQYDQSTGITVVYGSLSASNINVHPSGALLGNLGVVNGNTTISQNATVAAADEFNTPGTLTFNGPLTVNGTVEQVLDANPINRAHFGRINVGGPLVLNAATSTLVIDQLNANYNFAPGTTLTSRPPDRPSPVPSIALRTSSSIMAPRSGTWSTTIAAALMWVRTTSQLWPVMPMAAPPWSPGTHPPAAGLTPTPGTAPRASPTMTPLTTIR